MWRQICLLLAFWHWNVGTLIVKCTLLKPGTDVSVQVSEVCKSDLAGFSLTPRGLQSHDWRLIATWATVEFCCLIKLQKCDEDPYCNLFFLPTLESSAEVCLCHWCHHLPWSLHPWYLHQSDPGSFQRASPPDCDRPPCWPSATDWGFLCKHPHHCLVQHRLPTEIRGHCHPL